MSYTYRCPDCSFTYVSLLPVVEVLHDCKTARDHHHKLREVPTDD